MSNLQFRVQDLHREPRAKRRQQELWWGHYTRWSHVPVWTLTTIVCKCCCVKVSLECEPLVHAVFRKVKKQGRTYVFKCQHCKLRWIGKMPAGAGLTNVYKYPDGRIIGWDVRSDKPNKPNLAGDGHGWPIAQEENSDANATSQSLSTN